MVLVIKHRGYISVFFFGLSRMQKKDLQWLHNCFIPQSQGILLTKRYSACSSSHVQRVTKHSTDLEMEEVMGYVTCIHGSQWWVAVAQVLEKD